MGIDEKRAQLLLSQGNTISLEQPIDDGPRPRPLERFLQDDEAMLPDGEAIQAQEKMAGSPNHTTVYIPVGTNGLPMVHTTKR